MPLTCIKVRRDREVGNQRGKGQNWVKEAQNRVQKEGKNRDKKKGFCKTMESMRLKIPPPTDGSMASRDVVEVLHTPRRGHPTRRSLSNKRIEKSDLPPDADNTTRLATVDDSVSLAQNIFGWTWFVFCGLQNCSRPVIFSLLAFEGRSLHHQRCKRRIPFLRSTPKTLRKRVLLVLFNH